MTIRSNIAGLSKFWRCSGYAGCRHVEPGLIWEDGSGCEP